MRSPVQALLWEQWRQVWWTAPFALIITSGISLWLHAESSRYYWDVASSATAFASLLLAAGLLLFLHSGRDDIRPGIPARHKTLPVTPLTLVLSQYVFRLSFIVLLSAILMVVLTQIDSGYRVNIAPGIGIAATAMSLVTAVLWTVGTRSMPKAMLVCAVLGMTLFAAFEFAQSFSPLLGILTVIAFVAIFSFVAITAGIRRNSSPASREFASGEFEKVGMLFTRCTRAGSLYWFESQRKLRVIYAFTFAVLAGLTVFVAVDVLAQVKLALLPLYVQKYGYGLFLYTLARGFETLAVLTVCVPPVVAFFAGICFLMQDWRDGTLKQAHFVFTRPASTKEIVNARLTLGTNATLALCIPAAIASLCFALANWALMPPNFGSADNGLLTTEHILALLLSAAATWTLFWCPLSAVIALGWAVLGGTVLNSFIELEAVLTLIPAGIWITAIFSSVRLYRRGLMALRRIALNFAFAILWSASFFWVCLQSTSNDEFIFASATISAAILYTVVSQPLWIDFLRHGRFSQLSQRSVEVQ